MDVNHIRGSGGTERPADKPARTERSKTADPVRTPTSPDVAAISQDGRQTAQTVDALAERLQGDDADRRQLLDEVALRLKSGALDQPAVLRATARTLLQKGF
jgi:hypothetical protein